MISNRSLPSATIIPVVRYPDVRAAVQWLGAAFGFAERVRIGAGHRAQLEVGEGGGLIVAEARDALPAPGAVSHELKIRVSDVDSAFARARDAGARVLSEPTTFEYGERECTLEDPAGHRWQLTQTVRDTAPEEWGGVTVTS